MSFSDQLRYALVNHPKSIYRIARETGIDKSTLSRFIGGGRLTLPKIDTLVTYLKLELRQC